MTDSDRMTTVEAWPDGMEMIRQLRSALGLFSGAMPISPKEAWEEATAEARRIRAIVSDLAAIEAVDLGTVGQGPSGLVCKFCRGDDWGRPFEHEPRCVWHRAQGGAT